MRSFKDAKGREWTVEITIGSVRRLKGLKVGPKGESVDLMQPEAGEVPLLTRLATDVWLLLDVLYHFATATGTDEKPDADSFAEGLVGEVIRQAFAAFWEAVSDFFLSLDRPNVVVAIRGQLEIIQKMKEKSATIATEATQQGLQQMEAVNAQAEAARMLGAISGKSPELSA